MPLYQLLGGRSRQGALVYGHANGRDIAETSDEVRRHIELGFRAVRAQCAVPGLEKTYGIASAGKAYEPAESALPLETLWSTPQYLRLVPQLFEQLRVDHGDDVELLHDAHHRLTPIEAARLARDLEPYRLFWLEDATPAENQHAFELIRQHSVTPLAVGEVFNSIWDCKHLIEQQLIDFIRTTIVHAGGITHVRRLADFAALHQVRTGFHGATDLSPVCMGAALHFDAWVPNFGIQEWMIHSQQTDEVFPHDYVFRDGRLFCGESPGHGVTLDEKLAAKFPYSPKQLPIARLRGRDDVGLVMSCRAVVGDRRAVGCCLRARRASRLRLVRVHRARCGVRAAAAGRTLPQPDPERLPSGPQHHARRASASIWCIRRSRTSPASRCSRARDLVHWTADRQRDRSSVAARLQQARRVARRVRAEHRVSRRHCSTSSTPTWTAAATTSSRRKIPPGRGPIRCGCRSWPAASIRRCSSTTTDAPTCSTTARRKARRATAVIARSGSRNSTAPR